MADRLVQIWRRIRLPLASNLNKSECQEVLHAVEELYYFRRYDEAIRLVQDILREDNSGGLDAESRALLGAYEVKCRAKVDAKPAAT